MKNMEREKFEESLKNAFENAEVGPSDKVWMNIELDLEKAKGGHLKRRLMFYQMLAAASVVFAMAIGGIGYYNSFNKAPENSLTLQTPSPQDVSTDEGSHSAHEKNAASEIGKKSPENSQSNPRAGLQQNNSHAENSVQKDNNQFQALSSSRAQPGRVRSGASQLTGEREGSSTAFLASGDLSDRLPEFADVDHRALPPLYTPREIKLKIYPSKLEEVDPVLRMLANLDQRAREVQGEKKNKKNGRNDDENLWTSVGFAAGSFNTIQSAAPSAAPAMQTMAAAPIVDQETKASGYTYSMGVNLGTKIAERWVFQGGVNYLTHASEYTSDNVVAAPVNNFQQQRFRAASTNDVIHADESDLNNKIVYSAPYNVNNSMRYLSIPMQAGYLLVNKTFGLQLNAGVATDVFLQNTIKADSDQLDKTSQPGGSDSPYRSVNLSGLLGTELSYRFAEHYRVSLNPGLRYPFNTIYKSELGVQSMPLTFDVGVRFRYIFH
jgi:hypothetical protein